MKVVILCGGKGTRMREETEYRPKPMVEIGGKPILWHIMKLYAHYGLKEFVLCLGYRGEVIRNYFLNYNAMNNDCTVCLGSPSPIIYHNGHDEADWQVTLVDTGLDTPKGGRILRIQPYVDGSTFLLTYGDGIGDINIPALIDHHHRAKRIVTFSGVNPRSRFAIPELNAQGEVVSWKEKKPLEGYINGGFFVLDRAVFDYLTDDTEFEEEPMEKLAARQQVTMYPHSGRWDCMDTYRDYVYLNELWKADQAYWAIWERRSEKRSVALEAGSWR